MTGKSDTTASFDGVPAGGLWTFHRISTLIGVKIRDVFSGPASCHYFAITVEGVLYAWGRNDRGQLGLGHTLNVYAPTIVPKLPPILSASAGRNHSLLVALDGTVFAAGDNKMNQCGLLKTNDFSPTFQVVTIGEKKASQPLIAKSVVAGLEFSAAISKDGRLYTCGSKQFGQTGCGPTGEYIISAGKVGFGANEQFTLVPSTSSLRFSMVSAGYNHAAAVTEDGQAYTWGCGAYGRLGHGVTVDELTPKSIKTFESERMRVKSVSCGSRSSFFISKFNDNLYFCGILKSSGEANMVPKYFNDLQGWRMRSVSPGNGHTVVAAERAVITWGGGTEGGRIGELAYGPEPKSSAKPKVVETLDGLHAIKVAAGLGASLVILDTFSDHPQAEKARALCASGVIPTYVPTSDLKSATSASSSGKRKAEDAVEAGDKKKAKKSSKK
jgi:alpha-tubulin suppressor-like RCC1 family protein